VRFGELKAGVWDGGEAGNGNRVIRKAHGQSVAMASQQ